VDHHKCYRYAADADLPESSGAFMQFFAEKEVTLLCGAANASQLMLAKVWLSCVLFQ